jgi:hypothetical protein
MQGTQKKLDQFRNILRKGEFQTHPLKNRKSHCSKEKGIGRLSLSHQRNRMKSQSKKKAKDSVTYLNTK